MTERRTPNHRRSPVERRQDRQERSGGPGAPLPLGSPHCSTKRASHERFARSRRWRFGEDDCHVSGEQPTPLLFTAARTPPLSPCQRGTDSNGSRARVVGAIAKRWRERATSGAIPTSDQSRVGLTDGPSWRERSRRLAHGDHAPAGRPHAAQKRSTPNAWRPRQADQARRQPDRSRARRRPAAGDTRPAAGSAGRRS